MPLEYYIFAGFVFLLVLAVLYLNHMFKKSRSEGNAKDDRDRKLYMLYQNLEEEMLEMDGDIGRARQETDEKLKHMDEMLQKMEEMRAEFKAELERARAELPAREAAAPDAAAEAAKQEQLRREARRAEEKRLLKRRSPRAEQVRRMRDEGLEPEEIARSLAISRGEVELILGLR